MEMATGSSRSRGEGLAPKRREKAAAIMLPYRTNEVFYPHQFHFIPILGRPLLEPAMASRAFVLRAFNEHLRVNALSEPLSDSEAEMLIEFQANRDDTVSGLARFSKKPGQTDAEGKSKP
jgi:hypothetical protein